MSSSGTSSGLNLAGETQGSFVLTGSMVTMQSPLANCLPRVKRVPLPGSSLLSLRLTLSMLMEAVGLGLDVTAPVRVPTPLTGTDTLRFNVASSTT